MAWQWFKPKELTERERERRNSGLYNFNVNGGNTRETRRICKYCNQLIPLGLPTYFVALGASNNCRVLWRMCESCMLDKCKRGEI